MTRDESTTIITGLLAAFPTARMNEDTPDAWRTHLMPLDFEVADRAVAQCILNCEFFPSIKTFRDFYRLERHQARPQEATEVREPTGVPEWVHVWRWNLERTRLDRQVANEARYPRLKPEERPPKKMRDFPQQADPGPDVLTEEEYERVRIAWLNVGAPRIGEAEEVFDVLREEKILA